MALSTQPYKGARDFYPEDKRLQKYMFGLMRQVAESYGYEETDAAVLEPYEIYAAKTGDEIVNEQTYEFTDRGGRRVVIRPEWTPTISRMVAARRQELAYPLRLYAIPNLWRYERPQRGRLREHWQLNVDIFGVNNLSAEAEVIQVAANILKAAGATHDMYSIKLNNRQLMELILKDYLDLEADQHQPVAKLIDRKAKMELDDFKSELEAVLNDAQRQAGVVNKLLAILDVETIDDLPKDLRQTTPAMELKELLQILHEADVTNAKYDPSIMRGFDYYTGIVFEIFDEDPDNNRSMLGGGRYDGLVGLFGVEPVPTVGFGFGDVTLENFLRGHDLLPNLQPETDVYVVLIGNVFAKAQRVINEMRDQDVNVAVDTSARPVDKQLKTALKKGLNYVMFIGERDLKDEQFEIKNLSNSTAERHSLARIISIVKDYRND